MNNLLAALIERLAAAWIERIAGAWVTTIAGVLGIIGTAVAQSTTLIPEIYRPEVTFASVILAGVAAILSRGVTSSTTSASSSNGTQKIGVTALILLLMMAPMTVGCSGVTVAQDIVNWTPALQSAVNVVGSTASVLDPAAAPIFAIATVGFDAASNLVVVQAKAYLANPTAPVLAQLQAQVIAFQQQVNTSLLSIGKITNPASQQKALADVNAVATVINTILALLQGVKGASVAPAATVKLASVMQLMDRQQAVHIVAAHYGEPEFIAALQVDRAEYQLAQAGF